MNRTALNGLMVLLIGLPGCVAMREHRMMSRFKNKPAPDFELAALDGGKVRLSSFRGKPVVLAFFGYG